MNAASRPRIMFLCTGNSCRSQMAEGWTRHLHGATLDACSAGTNPHGLDPRAIAAMAEVGIDISGHTSNTPEEVHPESLDLVVTVCGHANEHCPVFPGETCVVHRGFDDPPRLARDADDESEIVAAYRRVRDEIRAFAETLPALVDAELKSVRSE